MNTKRRRAAFAAALMLFGIVCNAAAEQEGGLGSAAVPVAALNATDAAGNTTTAPYSEPILGRLDFAPETPDAADVVVRIVHQLSFGFAAGMIADGGMGLIAVTLGLLFSPLFLVSGEVDEVLYEMAHYAALGAHVGLYPLFVTAGVNAVGEVEGIRGSWLTPLLAYLGVGAGYLVYMAGYPELGTAAMFVLPLIGAVGGFQLSVRPVPVQQKSRTERRRALSVAAGSLLGESAYLSTRIFYPVIAESQGRLFDSLEQSLEGTLYDWLLMIPAASSLGAISTGKVVGRPGSWLLAAAGGMAGSLLGWGTTFFMDTPYTVPAVFLAAAGSTIGYLVGTPLRKRKGADLGMVSWNMMRDPGGRLGFNLRCSY